MRPSQILAFGLTKSLGGHQALDGVDLALEGGLITLLGKNGAGKTTLLRCLATITSPDAGSLLIDGLDPTHESDRKEIRRRLGYLPQAAGLSSSARVVDVVDYLGVLKHLGQDQRDSDRYRRHAVHAAIDRVGLADRLNERVGELSGGMQRRLGLAQAILGSPSLVLLDEPAAGLDPDERFRLRSIISERRHQSTVIQSTHLTDEAAVSDKVLVLVNGRLAFVGTPEALAMRAAGRTWTQATEPTDARASWRQANGSYRCLGFPPQGATLIEPTVEDGYLLLQPTAATTG